jgi:hypothetical protein
MRHKRHWQAEGQMERIDTAPRNDPILERIDAVQMGAHERERARDLMAQGERIADVAVAIAAAGRGLAERIMRVLQPRTTTRYRSADAR